MKLSWLPVTLFISASALATPETVPTLNDIRIVGRQSNTVVNQSVQLEDIADVSSPNIKDDDAVIALKKITIVGSPKAGKSISLTAEQVLSRLREMKVDLNSTGYSLPQTIQISRVARVVTLNEVQSAIESAIALEKRDIVLRSVGYREDVQVAPGNITIEAKPFFTQIPSQRAFQITVRAQGEPDINFRVNAVVDEWRQVPVAARSMNKGSVIGPNDVVMARLNALTIPRDAVDQMEAVVGYAVNNPVGYGEPLTRNKIELPPVVTAGSHVTIQYRSDFLDATATGIAMESGGDGQEIKVRNDGSKRVIIGRVIEPGLVRVSGGQ